MHSMKFRGAVCIAMALCMGAVVHGTTMPSTHSMGMYRQDTVDLTSNRAIPSTTQMGMEEACITADNIYTAPTPAPDANEALKYVGELEANFTAHASNSDHNINCVGEIKLKCWQLSAPKTREQCTQKPGCTWLPWCELNGKKGFKLDVVEVTVTDYPVQKTTRSGSSVIHVSDVDFRGDNADPGPCSTMHFPDRFTKASRTDKGSYSIMLDRHGSTAYKSTTKHGANYDTDWYSIAYALSDIYQSASTTLHTKFLANQTMIRKYPLSNVPPYGGYTAGACCFHKNQHNVRFAKFCLSDFVSPTSTSETLYDARNVCLNDDGGGTWENAYVLDGLQAPYHDVGRVSQQARNNLGIYMQSTTSAWHTQTLAEHKEMVGSDQHHYVKRIRKLTATVAQFLGVQSVEAFLALSDTTSTGIEGYTGCLVPNTDYTVQQAQIPGENIVVVKGSTFVKYLLKKPPIGSSTDLSGVTHKVSQPFVLEIDMKLKAFVQVSSADTNDLLSVQFAGVTAVTALGFDRLDHTSFDGPDGYQRMINDPPIEDGDVFYTVASAQLKVEVVSPNSMVLPVGVDQIYPTAQSSTEECPYIFLLNPANYPTDYVPQFASANYPQSRPSRTVVHSVAHMQLGASTGSFEVTQTVYFDVTVVTRCSDQSRLTAQTAGGYQGLLNTMVHGYPTGGSPVEFLFKYADLDISSSGYDAGSSKSVDALKSIAADMNTMNGHNLKDYSRLVVVSLPGVTLYFPGPEELSFITLSKSKYAPQSLVHIRIQANASSTSAEPFRVSVEDTISLTAESIANSTEFEIVRRVASSIDEVPHTGGDWLAWSIVAQDPAGASGVTAVGKYKFKPLYLIACTKSNTVQNQHPPTTSSSIDLVSPSNVETTCSQISDSSPGSPGSGLILYKAAGLNLADVYPNWHEDGDIQTTKAFVADFSEFTADPNGFGTTEADAKRKLDTIEMFNPNGRYTVYPYSTHGSSEPVGQQNDDHTSKLLGTPFVRTRTGDELRGAQCGFVFAMPSFTTSPTGAVKYAVTYEMAWEVTIEDGGDRRSYIESTSTSGPRRAEASATSAKRSAQTMAQSIPTILVKTVGGKSAAGYHTCPSNHTQEFTVDSGARCILSKIESNKGNLDENEAVIKRIEADTSDNGLILVLIILCTCVLILVGFTLVAVLVYQRSIHTMTWKLNTMLAKPNTRTPDTPDTDLAKSSRPGNGAQPHNQRKGLM